jgi:tripartite-type tricarboxylate transporter receptor subunit TctC
MRRRSLLAAPLLALPAAARAQDRPLRLILPFAPGGAVDTAARLLGQRIGEALGRAVVVDNRAGGNGSIAAQALLQAPADGSVLLYGAFIYGAVPHMTRVPYDALADFLPLTQTALLPTMLGAGARGRFTDAAGVLAALRAGQRVTFASGGAGTTSHLAAALFARAAGVEAEMVHYRGGAPALQGVIAGETDMMFDNPQPATFGGLQAGTLRGLLVMQPAPAAALAEVPTLAALGWGAEYTVQSWHGVFAPRGTPAAATAPVVQALREAVAHPAIRERFAALAIEPVGSTTEEFTRFFRDEFNRWGRFLAANPIRLD